MQSDGVKPTRLRVKKEEAPTTLTEDGIERRYAECGAVDYPITLVPGTHDRTITRRFLSMRYDGSSQDTFPKIGLERQAAMASRGIVYTEFLCPLPSWNPYVPLTPGARGLFFFVGDRDWSIERPLFVALGRSEWLYIGNYKGSPAESLTAEEWMLQSQTTKGVWVEHILNNSHTDKIRARIHLRKRNNGTNPTVAQVSSLLEKRTAFTVSRNDILEALQLGEERIGVICLKPVGFDEHLRSDINQRLSGRNNTLSSSDGVKRMSRAETTEASSTRSPNESPNKRKKGDLGPSDDDKNSDDDYSPEAIQSKRSKRSNNM
ncbi:hypothetical protein FRB95_009965 [Tulasnella sp. JGI-2019a]|nr:hypothetical protein FRB95_009965 [Tulasnella sp. JGI-2019a]